MLLDGETFDLVQHVETVLAAVEGTSWPADQPGADAVGARDRDAGVPHRGRVDARAAQAPGLRHRRRPRARACASARRARIPFSLFERQRITARDRYRHLVDQLQYVARRELIFGMHIHVAVDDPEKAIKVVNGLLAHLSSLLALSASSPFWRGEPTGLASSRQMVFAAFPRSGPPPRFKRLRGLRGGRRPAREDGLHRGLHPHLVGHPPAPALRDRRDTRSATRSRGSRTRSRSRRSARRW